MTSWQYLEQCIDSVRKDGQVISMMKHGGKMKGLE